jgi:phosphate transport system protein
VHAIDDWRYTLPRETFERQLGHLEDRVLALGSLVEKAILDSVRALKYRDMKRGRRLIADDRVINERRYAIEADTLALIAMQQPMAGDLRTLAAILEIVTELERIGDYAKGIARINEMIGEEKLIKPLVDLPRMADEAQDMLHQALDAFVRRDLELARAIPERDELVDELYKQVYRELITIVIAEPHKIEQSNYLLWAAHNLERAADRVTNICERVVFTVTGEMTELNGQELGIESVI